MNDAFFSEFNTQRKTTVKTVSEGGRRWLWKHRIPGIPGELLQINLFSPIWFLFTPLLISIFWSYGKISFFIPLFYFSKYPSNTLQTPLKQPSTPSKHTSKSSFFRTKNGKKNYEVISQKILFFFFRIGGFPKAKYDI